MSQSSRGRSGRPSRTSREQILRAARHLIERDGWQRLSMRRLAADVDISATTLYYHVRDKEDLLKQLLNHYADQLERPELPEDPRERILFAATFMHDGLARWPWVVEILTSDDLTGESALWMVEAIMSGAVEYGFTPERAVGLYRAIWYYTVGEILVSSHGARQRAALDRPAHRDTVIAAADPSRFPHLTGLRESWSELTSRDHFQFGLRGLVNGLLAQIEENRHLDPGG